MLAGKAVRHRFERRKGDAAAAADLRHCAALHLTQQGMEGIPDPVCPGAGDAEPVAGGHRAGAAGVPSGGHGGLKPGQLPGGELRHVDGGDHADGVAAAGGIHVVLDELLRQHQRADGNLLKAAGHAGVEDQIRLIVLDQQGGGHGGVDFAYAAAAGDHVVADAVKGNAMDRFLRLGVVDETADLRGHGVKKSDVHGETSFHRCWPSADGCRRARRGRLS